MKPFLSRRQALQEAALGFGGLALTSMIARAAETPTYSLRPRQPHFPAKAKNVIFIYVGGGPSTIDMFDPKPLLRKFNGQPAPFEIKGRALNGSQEVMASPWEFTRSGRSGREISNLLPYFQKVVDKVSFVPTMRLNSPSSSARTRRGWRAPTGASTALAQSMGAALPIKLPTWFVGVSGSAVGARGRRKGMR